MPREITTPPGRIVWGHPLQGQKIRDDNGQIRKNDEGNDRYRWSFGLAVPKDKLGEFRDAMVAEANELFPKGVPGNFAWKFKDGDKDNDSKGDPLSEKPGYAGCFVFAIETQYKAPTFHVYNHGEKRYEDRDSGVKRGDWVRVLLEIKAHEAVGRNGKPGLYLNPLRVLFFKSDVEIKGVGSATDPNDLDIPPPPEETPPADDQPQTTAKTETPATGGNDPFAGGGGGSTETPSASNNDPFADGP